MRVGMGYIKVILLVNIGLTFNNEIIDSEYLDKDIENPNKKIEYLNKENAKDIFDNISDEYLDKTIIHLLDKVYPKHYKVHLTVNTKSAYPTISLSGQVDINVTINSNNTIRTLLLHAKDIELDNVYTMLRNAKGIHYVNESYTIQEEILAINFMSKVPPDNYILTIVFNSTANDSFIRNKLPGKHATKKRRKSAYSDLILTHFRETATRQLFPCWDKPTYKATFDIEITHEAEYTVLSNMPISEISDADNDQPNIKCTKFITTPMMSTHQLVILLEPSKLIIDPRETVHTWRKSDRTSIISYMHNIVNDTLKYLLEYTNTTLYNQKIDHLLIPNASYSKAQLGLIIYRESDVIYDKNKDSISIKSEVMATIESQVAHQWFGGLVTPKFWNHSWLTESFALYFSHYSSKQAKLWKEILKWNSERFEKAVQLKIVENYHDVMRKDTRGSIPRVLSASLRIYGNHVYHKGNDT